MLRSFKHAEDFFKTSLESLKNFWFLSFSCRFSCSLLCLSALTLVPIRTHSCAYPRSLLCLSALTPVPIRAHCRSLPLTAAHSCTCWCTNIYRRMTKAEFLKGSWIILKAVLKNFQDKEIDNYASLNSAVEAAENFFATLITLVTSITAAELITHCCF